jgi:proliferating cell nuclear antigen
MNPLFRCKIHDAYILKILIELLQNNIKTGCFAISQQHISLRMTDSNYRSLFDVKIDAENFNMYSFHSETPINIGVNLNHMYKMMKSIKKKDSLLLFIDMEKQQDLGMQIIPKDQSRLTTSYIKIQNIQNLEIELPSFGLYQHHILVSSNEFAKMCKDMVNISNTMTINAMQYSVQFLCDVGSVYSKDVILGETDSTDTRVYFTDDYNTEQFARILKISGLQTSLAFHFSQDIPLWISSKIGNIGNINIFIKSKKFTENV